MPSRRYSHSAFQNTKIILTIIASIYAVYRAGIVAEIEQAEIKFLGLIVHFTVHLTIALAGFNISSKVQWHSRHNPAHVASFGLLRGGPEVSV